MEVKTDAKRRYLLYRLIVREHNFKINEIIGAVTLGVLCRYLYILKKIYISVIAEVPKLGTTC